VAAVEAVAVAATEITHLNAQEVAVVVVVVVQDSLTVLVVQVVMQHQHLQQLMVYLVPQVLPLQQVQEALLPMYQVKLDQVVLVEIGVLLVHQVLILKLQAALAVLQVCRLLVSVT
jgi:hypothetical protein